MSHRRPPLAAQRSPSRALLERFEIPDLDRPERNYLTRWRLIQTPWFGIYLHRFDGPDSRPTLHDHPWPFVSLVLRGGYVEHRRYGPAGEVVHPTLYGENVVRIRWINVKRATDVHWIDRLTRTPTWTLMLVGRRRREWGYVDRDGTWTRYDLHPHSDEFDAAMAVRRAGEENR